MSKEKINSIIYEERILYLGNNKTKIRQMKRSGHKRYFIFMYLHYFRVCQYYNNLKKSTKGIKRILAKYIFRFYEKKKNTFSYKSGVEIGLNSTIGCCCDIWHGGVVINGDIGDNCVFHGNNIIGNKGLGNENLRPSIGNNVDFGAGAMAIGDIVIADNCIIGAGAVITKSFNEPSSVIVGVPGKRIN